VFDENVVLQQSPQQPSATLSHTKPNRYLIQQGYSKEGDLVIITPYVGQLQLLARLVEGSDLQVAASGFRV